MCVCMRIRVSVRVCVHFEPTCKAMFESDVASYILRGPKKNGNAVIAR